MNISHFNPQGVFEAPYTMRITNKTDYTGITNNET